MTWSERSLRRLIWASATFIVVGSVAGIVMEIAAGFPSEVAFSLGLLTFPAVGFFILNRRPTALLGWLMVSMGFVVAVPLGAYADYALTHDLPFGPLALALDGPTWVPFIGISGYLLLLFPDGHLPSPRWRWFSWTCGIGLTLVSAAIWFIPGPITDSSFPEVVNPIGIEALKPILDTFIVLIVFAPALLFGGALGLVLRMRRTTDDIVRHQIRWLAYVAAWIAAIYVLAFVPALGNEATWTGWIQTIAVTSFALIPIAIGIAVLRYRLYDIDIVIRKTLVFAVMAAVIAVVYVGLVVGVGALVGSRSNPILSAFAAAIVALVFQPVRTRARRFADRVVYGKRSTPYEVMAEFGEQLAGAHATGDVLERTAGVLGEGVGAERAEVRLSVEGEMRQVASWPSDAPERADDLVAEVRHRGELLGELAVSMPANDPIDPPRERLVRDLAAQAGPVLRNERLTGQLRVRLTELKAAQKRLVTAQDHERRKLERNIHDGAQQQLVALQVRQRLAEQLIDRDPPNAKQMLGQLQVDTGAALEDLRDLARGIYPPLLADQGLPAALEAQARKSAVPVSVEANGIERLPQDVEAAVYFSVLEALQNTAKYAEATHASIAVERADGRLRFNVRDDGRGFDPSSSGRGSGLQGIADRLGALDGSVEITSTLGHGTVVTGSIPIDGAARGVPA